MVSGLHMVPQEVFSVVWGTTIGVGGGVSGIGEGVLDGVGATIGVVGGPLGVGVGVFCGVGATCSADEGVLGGVWATCGAGECVFWWW